MKKMIYSLIAVAFLITAFSGCSNANTASNTDSNSGSDKISIVTTIFPQYDFSREIAGENAEITMLLPPGSESHSYEPTPQDIIKIQNCDLFIYVGGESDTWVSGIIESMDKPVKTLTLMDCVDVVEEESVEGMEAEEEASGGEKEIEYDEHVWTSPKNAVKITEKITAALCEIDSANAQTYNANSKSYIDKLNALDKSFQDVVDGASNKTVVFGDRFPLRYFVDAYGLSYYAAFPGCSTDTEPSAATIAFLINKVKTEKISTVFYIEFSNHQVADSIAEATGAKTALFQSCHNVSQANLDSGATYLSLMQQNVETLREALK